MESTVPPKQPQLIPADDDDDIDESSIPAYVGATLHPDTTSSGKGKGRAVTPDIPDPTSGGVSGSRSPAFSGNIGSPATPKAAGSRRIVGGVQIETRYTGTDTLDEPILDTITRDLKSIYVKLTQVLYPRKSGVGREALRDWDLWGPLIFCLALAIMLSINAPKTQSLGVFTGVIAIVSLGSVIVTLNAKLLGGRVSLFQTLCVLGYCTFPLVIAGLISTFIRILWVRAPISLAAWAWSVWASINFLDGTKIEQQRVLLAVYPILLFYFILSWMILIQ
ncbi:Yip1-domain-containing protein [Cantharellus anzutake]|uniref:Yip1-domain-containing protein n=1 Tax=Cantharellus anzutake TaxID=1750568 RepID=UPI001908EEEE|nr:Yip1-domain-containing protein [Cantharellus anzutake]KAF8340506.1 Yip1-domain-containing protein [Cantharellus anzutake]